MLRFAAVAAVLLLLQACGTLPYTPMEYELRAGLIPPLAVTGAAAFENAQPSKDPHIVYSYGGTKLASNLHDITELMVQQAQKELGNNSNPKAGSAKPVRLKVKSLLSTYGFFSWSSVIVFEVAPGTGQPFEMTVNHASGSVAQDLNGCIAEGVMELLKDERVRTYLGS